MLGLKPFFIIWAGTSELLYRGGTALVWPSDPVLVRLLSKVLLHPSWIGVKKTLLRFPIRGLLGKAATGACGTGPIFVGGPIKPTWTMLSKPRNPPTAFTGPETVRLFLILKGLRKSLYAGPVLFLKMA